MNDLATPQEPLQVALIGAGQRSRTIYAPLFSSLKPWIEITAVCDPVKEHADDLAQQMEVSAFYDIHELVKARPMEAALVVTPVPSHHSISMYLSSHGIHNLAETTWCSLVAQARQMIETARTNGVVVRVGENFFRFPIDRIVQLLKKQDFIGDIHRIMCYDDHTGYHNNSRWIAFAGAHPHSVQAIEHTMPTAAFHSTPQRFHDHETYRARFFLFPETLMVVDHASNGKGFLGRHPRPGYTEWQGERGTIVYAAHEPWHGQAEIRYCSDQALATGRGVHDCTFPIVQESEEGNWTRTYVDLPSGRVEYVTPFRPVEAAQHFLNWYSAPIMDHIVDFCLAVRGLQPSEFDEQDAMMSLMMDVGARESVLNDGKRIPLPLAGDIEADRVAREYLRHQLGVDPMDVEGMLAISYPKP